MKERIAIILKKVFGADISVELSVPEEPDFGHYATNLAMRLAKKEGKAPFALAEELAEKIRSAAPAGFFEKVEAAKPGFINFWVSPETLREELGRAVKEKEYGRGAGGRGKTVIVEYSQPNIAKMMHVGHMRTTIIGDALANLFSFSGYKVIRWNYLGDWGTQFGKLIAAYKLWGDKDAVKKDPITELQKLYVRFHDEIKADPELERRGQEEFKKLENGDKENRALWEWFRKESLKVFEETYRTLGVTFDVWIGESFFEPEMRSIVKELLDADIAERSEGSIIVRLDAEGLPPALIEKTDGASLYLTRDIANLRYRLRKYKPAKILYVVGNEQALHFEQLFAIAKMLKLDSAELAHIKYGLVLGEAGKKLATREGRTVLLADVLRKATELTRRIVEEKNRELSGKEKDEVARVVALGALKYNDLKENRMTDIVFDWDKMLDFTGDSAPYLQYTYARFASILRKAGKQGKADYGLLAAEPELALMRRIFEFPEAAEKAATLYSTSTLATYLYRLAVTANRFYETTPIMKDENSSRRDARLVLAAATMKTLRTGLGLLGIATLEKI